MKARLISVGVAAIKTYNAINLKTTALPDGITPRPAGQLLLKSGRKLLW